MENRNLDKTAKQKELMIKALEVNYGNIRKAAKMAGISAQTHYRWCKEDNDYDNRAGGMKDLCYRNIKDDLIDSAMEKIKKGDGAVLSKMLGIFLKNLPDEMKILNRYNNVPLRMGIKYVDKPDWNREGYKKPE